jgi:transmembrane sensor
MSMSHDPMDIDPVLARRLGGTPAPGDEAALRAWVGADPGHAEQLEDLMDAWAMSGIPAIEDDPAATARYGEPAAAWARFLDGIRAGEAPPIPAGRRQAQPPHLAPPRGHGRRALFRGVAALAIVAGSILTWQALANTRTVVDPIAFASGSGQRKALRLPDGSRVVLGPESEIRIPHRFSHGSREVHLSGTALFEVVRDSRHPFRVHAGGTVTRVVGTRFVVRAYPDESEVEVAVAEGEVAFRARATPASRAIKLRGGQLGEVNAGGVARMVAGEDTDRLLGWTEGRLVFSDRPLAEIAAELERWYGVEVGIADPALARRRLTLSFAEAPLREVLGVIAASLGVEVECHEHTVRLTPAREE